MVQTACELRNSTEPMKVTYPNNELAPAEGTLPLKALHE